MNPPPDGAFEADSAYTPKSDVDVVVFPTLLDIKDCVAAGIVTGGQCGHPDSKGAHTGDISMHMLQSVGATWVLCGHSERRTDHGETDEFVAAQVTSALSVGLNVIVCVGETLAQRDAGEAQTVVKAQLSALGDTLGNIVIAYEPIWAIGTGKACDATMAEEMHAYIRSLIPENHRDAVRILYGGSMKPENAAELLAQPNIDGGLVGSASLDPQKFATLISLSTSL